MRRLGRIAARTVLVPVAAAAVLWAALALHYAPLVAAPWGAGLIALMLLATVLAFVRLPAGQASLASLFVPFVVLAAFLHLRASNDRAWQPEYRVLASATRDGDLLHIHNIRNFAWTSDTDATPAYDDATFNLNDVQGVDLVLSYWAGDTIAHVFVSFAFADGRHLAISVETRRAEGQDYSTLGGFFRNYELTYVIADERDLIGVRTDMRRERVYVYRLQAPANAVRMLLLSYLDKANALAATPEFYNTLTDNCTSNVAARIADIRGTAGGPRYSWKLVLSGYTDSYAYDRGVFGHDLEFDELKRRSRIERAPGARIGPGFSADIRAGRAAGQ